MKKISVAVLAAAMLAGTVTAADIGFSYKGSNYFQGKSGNVAYAKDLRQDCLAVMLTTDVAGVVIDYDSDIASGSISPYIKPDEYYGWFNFGLPVGQLQVTAGAWNGRWVNRVVTDKGDLDREDFELFKPGIINGLAGKDSDNLTNGNLGVVAAWTLADVLPGTLLVKLGIASYKDNWGDTWLDAYHFHNRASGAHTANKDWNANGNWSWNPDKDSVNIKAGFTGEVAYRQEGAFAANLAVRSLNKHTYSFGAWISPDVGDTLQLTLGGTVATGKGWESNAWSSRKNEWGLDLRLRLQVTDDLSITSLNNLSSGAQADGRNEGVLWNMVNATYAFAENLTAGFTLQSIADVFCPVVNESESWTVILSPSLAIQASERVRITTSARATMPQLRNYALKHIELTVPVIFTFNY